ncbi:MULTISPECIES: VOC family protein [unclassified Chelatococcus]|uniref:VOC family protein n=1 Tax=unclassified Chelatococcus TaxID=2638111 RepID=UPI001BD10DE9|nr:VOC family protein [Chelatococcus sp.]MBS7700756.1 VOC family protein [Chelatococcus sp. YT9]MBX3559340.1 VOC family protein [Chelatococcus sp.]
MIYELNHFGIVVRDLQKSLDFYQGLLGARIVYKGFIPPSKTDVIYLLIAGGLIELLHPAEPGPDTKFGITHIAFMSNDLDADYERLTGLGYVGHVAPKVAGSGVGRLAFLGDPNGARVELIQRDVPMRDDPPQHAVIRAFDHYSLLANDLDGALKLYRDAMGMKVLKEMTVPHPTNPLSIVYLNWDYDVLELLHRPSPDPKAELYGHFALRVDNVDEALQYFADHGIPAEPGTPKAAGTGIGRIGIIRDPDGVKIELVDRADLRDLP